MRHTLIITAATVVLTLGAAQAPLGATYYRWIDDRGHTVHSDRPPPKGVEYEVISTESSFMRPVEADEGAVPLSVDPNPSDEFTRIDTGSGGIEKNPEFCQRALDNLTTLATEAQIQVRNSEGELVFLSDEQRQEQVRRAEETAAEHCDEAQLSEADL
ncbi:MAG: DUF4124 domain-containing protein [Pseudomonadota bacterium]